MTDNPTYKQPTQASLLGDTNDDDAALLDQNANVVIYAKKPNPWIMSTSELSATETFYNTILFAYSQDNLGKKRKHAMSTAEFREIVEYKRKDLKQVRDALENLTTKGVSFGILDLDNPDAHFEATAWLASVKVKRGMIEWEYSSVMEERLIEWRLSKGYTKVELAILRNFKSKKYAQLLYELCKRFTNVKSTGFRPYDWWKEALGANRKAYKSFFYFNRDVLGPAINDVNEKSDLFLSPVIKGNGREIKILIEPNPNFLNPMLASADDTPLLLGPTLVKDNQKEAFALYKDYVLKILLQEFGLDNDAVPDMLEKFNSGDGSNIQLKEFLEYLLQRKHSGKINTHNLAGYAFKTLQGYKRIDRSPKSAPIPSHEELKKLEDEKRSRGEFMRQAYDEFIIDKMRTFYDALEPSKRQTINAEFIRFLSQHKVRVTRDIITTLQAQDPDTYPFLLSRMARSYFVDFCKRENVINLPSKQDFIHHCFPAE